MITPRAVAGLVLAASVAALAAAFLAQYVAGLEPCPLCVWQRYPYGATLLLGAAALCTAERGRWPAALIALAAAAFAADAAIAFYHVGVEEGWYEGLAACAAGGGTPATVDALRAQLLDAPPPPRCDEVAWSLFGVSMAGYNMMYAASLAGFSLAAAAVLARRAKT